jgi:hypothetical protein
MQTKKSCDQRTSPNATCHSSQQSIQEKRVGSVEEQVGEVMPRGVQSVDLAIQHVGKPGQGMPVARVKRCERPHDALGGQTALHHRVLEYIRAVVDSDKSMTHDLKVHGKVGESKQRQYQDLACQPLPRLQGCSLQPDATGLAGTRIRSITLWQFLWPVCCQSVVRETMV